MRYLFLISCLLGSCYSINTYADWKPETIQGLYTFIFTPKTVSLLKNQSSKRALMINLHGCAQKADDLVKDGNWEKTANEYNMIVAIPRVPNGGVYSGCWDYYGADHTEANRHNGAVLNLVKNLLARTELNIDKDQVYVSGLSSGGGLSMILGCLSPDVFAGMGLNAAPSTGTSANEISRPQTSYDKMFSTCKNLSGPRAENLKTQLTSIIYGNNDFVVSTAFDLNNAKIMSTLYNAPTSSTFDTKKLEGALTDGTGTLYSDASGPRISVIMNTNLGHNWPAGQGGNGVSFINKKSINYPAYLTKFFFTNNRRAKNVKLPELLLSPVEFADSKFVVSGELTVSKDHIKGITVEIRKKDDLQILDVFKGEIDQNGKFSANSKKLPSDTDKGNYDVKVRVSSLWGTHRDFTTDIWLGEIPGVNAPQLVNVNFTSTKDCIDIKGQAVNNGGDKVTSVNFQIDSEVVGSAEINNTQWKFQYCGIVNGKHTLNAHAVNESGLQSNIETFTFDIDSNSATATVQEHMEAGRLKWEEYGVWYNKYGNRYFTLYQRADHTWGDRRE